MKTWTCDDCGSPLKLAYPQYGIGPATCSAGCYGSLYIEPGIPDWMVGPLAIGIIILCITAGLTIGMVLF